MDTEKFAIQVIPFETDDRKERYKYIHAAVERYFSEEPSISVYEVKHQILNYWQSSLLANGGNYDVRLRLSKADLIWPIITILVKPNDESLYSNLFDPMLLDEVNDRYQPLIEDISGRFDFITKVISAYQSYQCSGTIQERREKFINSSWKDYETIFNISEFASDEKEALIKVILCNIINQQYKIRKLKSKVGL